MTVAVADNRSVPPGPSGNAQADATTGWTGTSTLNLFTSDPDPIELSGCLGMAVGESVDDLYYAITSDDLSDTLIYVWVQPNGTMDTLANGGVAITIGDGSDYIGYHLAGSDLAGFRHAEDFPAWQCLVIDTSLLPTTNYTEIAGTEAGLTLTAITRLGAMFTTLSKALGGSSNCFTDVIRVGAGGLTITTGTSGAPGTFAEIATEDRDNTDGKGYGIIRELGAGLFGLQGALVFGDNSGTVASFFADTNATVAFEDRFIGDDKYKITIVGNSTGSTTFKLGLKVGTGDTATGSDGCIITSPDTIAAEFIATDADLQFLLLYGTLFRNFTVGLSFSADATNGPNHELIGCTLANCGQVTLGRIVCRNTLFTGYTPATDAALLWNANIDIKNCSFTNNEGAIEHPTAGTFNYTGMTFSGNTYDIVNSSLAVVTDSYSESNQDGTTDLNGTNNAAGQEITGDGGVLSRARFYLSKTLAPTGNMVAKVYASDLASPAAPTGAILATSNLVAASTVGASLGLIDFEFEDEFTLVNTTKYFIVIEYTSGTGTDYISVGYDGSAPGHGGNYAVYTTSWAGDSGKDACFYVNTGGIVKINATDSDPSTTIETAAVKGATILVNSVDLTVRVSNQAGSALPSINVRYEESDGTEISQGATNGSGVYTFAIDVSLLPLSNTLVIIRNKAFEDFETSVDIPVTGFDIPISLQPDLDVDLP
jgi:hypothetical protein